MCMIGDADDWDLFDQRVQRARKSHCCTECGRTIERGETYQRSEGLIDGAFYTHKTCAHCVWASGWLMRVCNGYIFNCVLEDLREHWVEEPSLRSRDLATRIIGMRRRWKNRDGILMAVPTSKVHVPALDRVA